MDESVRRVAVLCAAAFLVIQPAHASPWKYTRLLAGFHDATEVAMSETGRVVAVVAYPTGVTSGDQQVLAVDTVTHTTTLVSAASNGRNYAVGISGDGRYVVFTSSATTLVPGDRNGNDDVFVRDLKTRKTTRVSLGPGGKELPKGGMFGVITRDGSAVAYQTLDAIYVRTLRTGKVVVASADSAGKPQAAMTPSFSANGRYLAFASWARLTADAPAEQAQRAYVRDLVRGTLVRVPDLPVGAQGASTTEYLDHPLVDPTGTWVAARSTSYAPLSMAVQIRDVVANLTTGTVTVLSTVTPYRAEASPAMSPDGAYVVYDTREADAATGPRVDGVYRRSLRTGIVERVSGTAHACAGVGCAYPLTKKLVAGTGDRVGYLTTISESADDTDGTPDVYLVSR